MFDNRFYVVPIYKEKIGSPSFCVDGLTLKVEKSELRRFALDTILPRKTDSL